jgi:hypothetical protein
MPTSEQQYRAALYYADRLIKSCTCCWYRRRDWQEVEAAAESHQLLQPASKL